MLLVGTSWGQPRTSREGMMRGHPRICLSMLGKRHLMAVPDNLCGEADSLVFDHMTTDQHRKCTHRT